MIVKIIDIPPGGKDVEFAVSLEPFNRRVNSRTGRFEKGAVLPPDYVFIAEPQASAHLELQGETVTVEGRAKGTFRSCCARCGEEIDTELSTQFRIFLKPRATERADLEDEDVDFGFYDGKEINCSDIVEEHMILNLPYTVFCSEQQNDKCSLPIDLSQQEAAKEPDARFAVLRGLKIN